MQSNTSLNDAISANRANGSKNVTIRDAFALLRTAIPMTEAERTIAQANVTYAQSEISLLNKEFSNAKYISVKRKSRLGELRRFEELERGLLAPIRRLPAEILKDILLLAHYYSHYRNSCKVFPLVAAQVCSYWRMTAHSIPSLWTNISFKFKSEKLGYGKLIEYCLQYSKEMPLSISLDSSIVQGPELLGDSCVQMLGQNAHRWQYVNFDRGDFATALFGAIPEEVMLEDLQFLTLGNMYYTNITLKATPKLSRISLGCYAWTADESNVHITIESAPNLTHLTLDFMHRPSDGITGLDWSLIEQFEARHVKFAPHELNHILERMQNLLSLELDSGNIGTRSNITLPRLQFLSIEGKGNIFNVLTTPCLKELYIGYIHNEGSLTKAIVKFARRSNFRLEKLTVHNDVRIDNSWLIPEFKTVKKLALYSKSAWRTIKCLTFGSAPSSPNVIFPMLENLTIDNLDVPPPNTEWGVTMLVDMLKSRLAHPEQTGDLATRGYLKYVQISFKSALSGEDAKICSEFVKSKMVQNSGVELHITNEKERCMAMFSRIGELFI